MPRVFPVLLITFLLLTTCGCSSTHYRAYQFDNGDDYVVEGLRRIVDKSGRIGFADETGRVAVAPHFAFAFPFENGVAKATFEGKSVAEGEYHRWISPEWFYIDRKGNKVRSERRYAQLKKMLESYVSGKDARIGIAVIINGQDTVAVNGNRDFPMMSVYKFPQALAVADYCQTHDISLTDSIFIRSEEIKIDTWSPLREKYGVQDMKLPLSELLSYSVKQSDNNACDILFRIIGGTERADSVVKSIGYKDIHILSTEDEMHKDPYLCYANRATPIEMARLFDRFYRLGMNNDSPIYEAIGMMMMSCETGLNRLTAPLKEAGVEIAHKTGTGDRNSQGRIIGINDAGYVFLPDGRGYSIAVFIADSAYDVAETEELIAGISDIVFKMLGE